MTGSSGHKGNECGESEGESDLHLLLDRGLLEGVMPKKLVEETEKERNRLRRE